MCRPAQQGLSKRKEKVPKWIRAIFDEEPDDQVDEDDVEEDDEGREEEVAEVDPEESGNDAEHEEADKEEAEEKEEEVVPGKEYVAGYCRHAKRAWRSLVTKDAKGVRRVGRKSWQEVLPPPEAARSLCCWAKIFFVFFCVSK